MDIDNENIIMLLDAHNDNSSKSTLFNNFYKVLKNGIMKQDKRRITKDNADNYEQTQMQEKHKKELQNIEEQHKKELEKNTDKIQKLKYKLAEQKEKLEKLEQQKEQNEHLIKPLGHSQSIAHDDISQSKSSLAQQFTEETNKVSDINCVRDIINKLTPRLVNINHRFQTSLKVDDIPIDTPLTAFNIHQYKLINYYLERIR